MPLLIPIEFVENRHSIDARNPSFPKNGSACAQFWKCEGESAPVMGDL
jgi:hypothetical protein